MFIFNLIYVERFMCIKNGKREQKRKILSHRIFSSTGFSLPSFFRTFYSAYVEITVNRTQIGLWAPREEPGDPKEKVQLQKQLFKKLNRKKFIIESLKIF